MRTQPTQPTQTCTVAGGTGTVGSAAVTSVVVNCATNRFLVGGTISGLAGTVTLQNNAGDDLPLTANGTFAFATPLLSGATYNVTVKTQPTVPSQTCAVANRSGTVGGGNVTNVAVTCTTNVFTIGGAVSGLAPGNAIILRNNGGNDLVQSVNGGFTFTAPVASGQAYAVTIVASPLSPVAQTCSVASGAGVVGGGNVIDVAVTCETRSFLIRGTASGMTGAGAVLQLSGGETLPVGDGSFSFQSPVASGASYNVTVVSAPLGRTCTVANGSGTVAASDVTNVDVTCVGVAPSSGSFVYAESETTSATRDTTNVDVFIVAGQTLSIGTCIVPGASGTGDTYLRLFNAASLEVASDDDQGTVGECGPDGFLTFFTFTATTTETFQVRAGCFQEQTCDGTVAYTLSGT
ncbi:MAG: hypothetical protein H7138_17895 [Myxococcales bacterium]|nr:hypothetical protein [Myxococcales bacterium]